MGYRYYSTQRPVSPFTYPETENNPSIHIHNFERRVYIPEIGRRAWGYIDYREPLTEKEADDYELVPEAFFSA